MTSKRMASGSVFSHITSTMYKTCIRDLPLFAPCASFVKLGDRSVKPRHVLAQHGHSANNQVKHEAAN